MFTVVQTKLLGVIIRDDLRTCDNTSEIERKCYKRIWLIKRLASLGCKREQLVTVYVRQIRSLCEFAVTYWGPMITINESRRLERIQRTALHVILNENYVDYKGALEVCNIESLSERRESLLKNFAVKLKSNDKFQHWFAKSQIPERE